MTPREMKYLDTEDLAIFDIVLWELSRLDFHGDPADEIIAATSLVEKIPLLTRDRSMRRSKIVPLAI